MNLSDLMKQRRSVRAFLDEPVPRHIIEQILADASRAPSAINMQPWEVHMVLGNERKRLSERLMRAYRERAFTCGPGSNRPIPDKFIARARECADLMNPLAVKMGSDFKKYVNEGSLNFYGAPAVAFIFIDESFQKERFTDIGIFMAYLLLSAHARGVGTCPIGLVNAYQDEIKDYLNISDEKILVVSVCFGNYDKDVLINTFKSPRIDTSIFVRWVD